MRAVRRQAAAEKLTRDDLREAIVAGALMRVRPIVMTVAAVIGGLLPIMWGSGTGSEVMGRIAAPMVGGMVSVTVLAPIVIPAIYAVVRGYLMQRGTARTWDQWEEAHAQHALDEAPFDPIHSEEKHMKRATIAALTFVIAPLAVAQPGGMKGMDMNGMDMKGADKGAGKTQAQAHRGAGTVKSVDLGKGTVTIAHGPVASLSWPAMTMTFKRKDAKILGSVKSGQKIVFQFIQQGREYVVTSLY